MLLAIKVSQQVTGAVQTRYRGNAFGQPNIKSKEKKKSMLCTQTHAHAPIKQNSSRYFVGSASLFLIQRSPRGAFSPPATSPFPPTHFMLWNSICVLRSLLGRSQSASGLEVLPARAAATSMARGSSRSPTSSGLVISQPASQTPPSGDSVLSPSSQGAESGAS